MELSAKTVNAPSKMFYSVLNTTKNTFVWKAYRTVATFILVVVSEKTCHENSKLYPSKMSYLHNIFWNGQALMVCFERVPQYDLTQCVVIILLLKEEAQSKNRFK